MDSVLIALVNDIIPFAALFIGARASATSDIVDEAAKRGDSPVRRDRGDYYKDDRPSRKNLG